MSLFAGPPETKIGKFLGYIVDGLLISTAIFVGITLMIIFISWDISVLGILFDAGLGRIFRFYIFISLIFSCMLYLRDGVYK